MGYNVNEGYYQLHVKKQGYKITDEQEKFNATDDILEGIKIASAQWEKDMKDISKVHLQDRNKVVPKVKLEEAKEKETEIVPFIRNNIESINKRENQRASGGEER